MKLKRRYRVEESIQVGDGRGRIAGVRYWVFETGLTLHSGMLGNFSRHEDLESAVDDAEHLIREHAGRSESFVRQQRKSLKFKCEKAMNASKHDSTHAVIASQKAGIKVAIRVYDDAPPF